MSVEEEYMRALQQFRRQKDEYFRTAPASPIPESERATFQGLNYFPALFALRLVVPVAKLPAPEQMEIATTDGQTRLMERYANLKFTVADQPCTLTAFRSAESGDGDGPQSLFIPFRDALSGTQTYGAGRYLDVEEEIAEDGAAVVTLDFNLAYNPYCAYNENYSCPITPLENTLPIAIRAGERIYHEE